MLTAVTLAGLPLREGMQRWSSSVRVWPFRGFIVLFLHLGFCMILLMTLMFRSFEAPLSPLHVFCIILPSILANCCLTLGMVCMNYGLALNSVGF